MDTGAECNVLPVKDRALNAAKFTEPSRNKLDETNQQQTHRLFAASSCMANVYLSKTVRKNYNKQIYYNYKLLQYIMI